MAFMTADDIRTLFSRAMSDMYRAEVPQYGTLVELVRRVNEQALRNNPARAAQLRASGQLERLDEERHGAVRIGTAGELATLARVFAVMGMHPVGYYDLSVAGVPVHATAFRPVHDAALDHNPFRVFTSLLRLELVPEPLRTEAAAILKRRDIFTSRCLELLAQAEMAGGLAEAEAQAFVGEALETFRWHSHATVDLAAYRRMRAAHALVADIVCFKGPHINHLTPRTLDIDAAQAGMGSAGLSAKAEIEGPPRRAVPILLRQTSFLALEEPVRFGGEEGGHGSHTARFGEIEQRGCALTHAGRARYDELLAEARRNMAEGVPTAQAMCRAFSRFPDDGGTLHKEGLAFFHYRPDLARAEAARPPEGSTVDELLDGGWLRLEPMTYEDFLPVSAAGIFRSNLGNAERPAYAEAGSRSAFEAALGRPVMDEIALYAASQHASLCQALYALGLATRPEPGLLGGGSGAQPA